MKKLWVLVANSSNAKIFSVNGIGKEIKKIHDVEHPDSRKKGREILTDRPGRAYDRVGEGRHAVGKNPLTHEHQIFAHEIYELVKRGYDSGSFEEIAVIAPPNFLGELRQTMIGPVKNLITQEIDKDIVSTEEPECINLMCRYLNLWNH